MSPLLERHREKILELAEQHGAGDVRVFGSLARGEGHAASDIDLLVSLGPGRSLLDLVALKLALEQAIGCPVDVVTERALSPLLQRQVLAEAVRL
ncbi:MAG TPA: nucleotidyltransferase family protein [Thermoanaerobaculia bacterium]|nr:nucleotidyltransferase family protein [Thermoanaerobaculia bacterium]